MLSRPDRWGQGVSGPFARSTAARGDVRGARYERSMRLFLAALAAAAWLFVSGAILFAAVLPDWFAHAFGAIVRDPKDLPLWAVGLEKLRQGVGLALLLRCSPWRAFKLLPIPLLLVTGPTSSPPMRTTGSRGRRS